jgi:hypothetical protein
MCLIYNVWVKNRLKKNSNKYTPAPFAQVNVVESIWTKRKNKKWLLGLSLLNLSKFHFTVLFLDRPSGVKFMYKHTLKFEENSKWKPTVEQNTAFVYFLKSYWHHGICLALQSGVAGARVDGNAHLEELELDEWAVGCQISAHSRESGQQARSDAWDWLTGNYAIQTNKRANKSRAVGADRAARNSRSLQAAHYPIHGAEMCAKSLRALLAFNKVSRPGGAHLLFLRRLRPIKAAKVTSLACVTFEHQPPFYYFVCERGRRAPGQLPTNRTTQHSVSWTPLFATRADRWAGGCVDTPNMWGAHFLSLSRIIVCSANAEIARFMARNNKIVNIYDAIASQGLGEHCLTKVHLVENIFFFRTNWSVFCIERVILGAISNNIINIF